MNEKVYGDILNYLFLKYLTGKKNLTTIYEIKKYTPHS
jgi:hypothetical protein